MYIYIKNMTKLQEKKIEEKVLKKNIEGMLEQMHLCLKVLVQHNLWVLHVPSPVFLLV